MGEVSMKPRIYIGWDNREEIAYEVCVESLKRHASVPPDITALKQDVLRKQGFYWRSKDPLASTEFTYTRFLVPKLANYEGWALFCDCDILFTTDVVELFSLIDNRYAMMCIKHDHRPNEKTKMDGVDCSALPGC